MDRWTPLAPTRAEPDAGDPVPLFQAEEEEEAIGTVPPAVVLRILDYVPLTSLPHVEQASKALQARVRDERLWKKRWDRLAWRPIEGMPDALLDGPAPPLPAPRAQPKPPPTQRPSTVVDLLGDLDEAPTQARPYADRMQRAYRVLRPFFASIVAVPSTTSSLLFTHPHVRTLDGQCALMHNLARMASRLIHGVPADMVDDIVRAKLASAAGYLDMELRTAFLAQVAELAQGRDGAEAGMRRYAHLAWGLRELGTLLGIESRGPPAPRAAAMHARGGSGVAAAYVAECPLFHEPVPHNPKKCIQFYERSDTAFTEAPVRAFEDHLEARVVDEVARMQRVFPHAQGIELVFFEKLASDLVRGKTDADHRLFRRSSTERRGTLAVRLPRGVCAVLRSAPAARRGRGACRPARRAPGCTGGARHCVGRTPRYVSRGGGDVGAGHARRPVPKVAAQRTSPH